MLTVLVCLGYYPPNHDIVTGSENLDSFEALLWVPLLAVSNSVFIGFLCRELAELLGQVKPPVATKEEIEKSGLEIIKPADLERYEKEGRVASNCVERVNAFLPHPAKTFLLMDIDPVSHLSGRLCARG
jgi:hypothetical protein